MPTGSGPSQATRALPVGIKVRHESSTSGGRNEPKHVAANSAIADQSSSVAARSVKAVSSEGPRITRFTVSYGGV